MDYVDTSGKISYYQFMPYRITPLVNEEFYHVYNRGVAKLPTYFSKNDYGRFMLCLSYYRFKNVPSKLSKLLQIEKQEREKILIDLESTEKIVEIIAFCLMPNHFHLLLKQTANTGISTFLKKITDSYTRYFNTRHERIGPLFQGAFKTVHVETNEQLLHLSRYIHLNPLVSFVVREEKFKSYPWSSLFYYLNGNFSLINPHPVLDQFKKAEEYLRFIMDRAEYGKQLEKIKHLVLE